MLIGYARRRLGEYAVGHRRTGAVRYLAAVCRDFLTQYENLNYDPRRNGERFMLEAMAAKGLLTCIFDVGACVGEWALMAREIAPGASLHCFEIVAANAERLLRNVQPYPNIFANSCGLSHEDGVVTIRYFPDQPTLSTMTDYPHELEAVVTSGVVTAGDSYIARHDISRVNLLKIDVEGAEELVLKGFSNALANGMIDVIQFEYGKVNILTRFLLRDIYEMLEGYGYTVGKLYPNYVEFRHYTLDDENFFGPNYVAILKDRRELVEAVS